MFQAKNQLEVTSPVAAMLESLGMAKITSLLGLRIAARLADIKQNQTWLAERLSLSTEAISKWARGDGGPKYVHLLQMAKELDCSVGYLTGDQADESIAEVVRRMEAVDPEHRKAALVGVIAVLSTLPKSDSGKQKAA